MRLDHCKALERCWARSTEGINCAQVAKREWMESVRLVFDYFCERTPRSFVETRASSVVWNYKYADVEFGRLQVRVRWLAHGSAANTSAAACGRAPSPTRLLTSCRRVLRDKHLFYKLMTLFC